MLFPSDFLGGGGGGSGAGPLSGAAGASRGVGGVGFGPRWPGGASGRGLRA